ncbi:MAG: tetratricopeptide repeat protein [Acidobacteriia bacterium]|nr:tetratricopeptide repeat protein [Terriglobia bacterium]
MKPPCFLLLLVVLLPATVQSQIGGAQAGPSDPVAIATDHLRNLEYEEAIQQLQSWLETHPKDLRAHNYLGISVLYQQMFHRGVLESRVYGHGGDVFKASKAALAVEFQEQLLSILEKAQSLADQRARSDPKDKEAVYWAGVTHATRATYHFTLRKEYMPSLHESTDALKLHRTLLELDPNYVDAYLVVGMNNYIVGSLPWYIKVLASLTGHHGDRAEGIRQVKRVTEEGNYAREDARLMLAVLYQREKMYREALHVYEEMARAYPRNYLLPCEIAALHGSLSEWPSAAQLYDSVLQRHYSGQPGYAHIPLARTLYLSGEAYERSDQPESALSRYSEAGALTGGDRYSYRAQLRTGDILVRLQRTEEARTYYKRVAEVTPDSEEGKVARDALKRTSRK